MKGSKQEAALKKLDHRERQRKALELRKAGATYQQIADALGYKSQSSAYKVISQALEEIVREPAEELLAVQRERLNHMLTVLWPEVQRGNLQAMDRALKIMSQQDALEGFTQRSSQTNNVLVIGGQETDYITALRQARGEIVDIPSPKAIEGQ